MDRKPIIQTILSSRDLIYTFALRDLKVKYSSTFLGYIWAVLPQLATVALFTMLAQRRVFNMGATELPYVLHALWSLSLWQLFSIGLLNAQNSLAASGNLILKVNFEKVALVLSSQYSAGIDFLIRLVPILIACWWYSYTPTLHLLLIPVVIFFVILMAFGLGLYLSCINLVFKDLGNMVSIVLTFGMFLSPILYPPPTHGLFSYINFVNPFSPLLIATQQLMAGRMPDNLTYLGMSMLLAVVLFISGWRFFHQAIPRMIERA